MFCCISYDKYQTYMTYRCKGGKNILMPTVRKPWRDILVTTYNPSGHLVPPPFGGLQMLWLLRPVFPTLHRINYRTKLDLHRIKRGFHGAFATGVASQQGALTLPDTWFRPPFWDLLMLQLLRPNSSNLPCLCSTFHLEYPLVLSRFYLLLLIC